MVKTHERVSESRKPACLIPSILDCRLGMTTPFFGIALGTCLALPLALLDDLLDDLVDDLETELDLETETDWLK